MLGLIKAVYKLEGHSRLATGHFIVMVETDNLHLVIGAADVYSLCISHLEELLRHTQTATNINIIPIGIVQAVPDLEGININDANDFQRPLPRFGGTIKGVLNSPLTQLGRVENRFTTGHLSGQDFTSLTHCDLSSVVCNHMNLSRRTLLAQSIQSVIHRRVRLAQFQSGLCGIAQEIGFIQSGANFITPGVCSGGVSIQLHIEIALSGKKLFPPCLKGFGHIGRGLDDTGLSVALDAGVFHTVPPIVHSTSSRNSGTLRLSV